MHLIIKRCKHEYGGSYAVGQAVDKPWTVPCLGKEPVAGIDDVHRMLTRDVIGKKLDMVVLRDFTTRLEMTVTPAEYQE